MSDNPFEETVPAPEPTPADDLADLIEDVTEEAVLDASQCVTLRSTNGQSFQIPVEGPTLLADVLARSELGFGANVEFWVNGNRVPTTETVAPGAVVTAVGIVKGGRI